MKIGFLGDLVLDRKIQLSSDLIKISNKLDLVLLNLEGVFLENLKVKPLKTYGSIVFNNKEFVQKVFDELKVTHVNIYNNHMYDFGRDSLEYTIECLKQLGINVLSSENYIKSNNENNVILNSGMAENFGIQKISDQFGINANSFAIESNIENIKNRIVNTHFGIEMIEGFSKYEFSWFNIVSSMQPSLIIRHHPHCIQKPFFLNKVPCFPSIGDFAFNFGAKYKSEGLFVIMDSTLKYPYYYKLKCENGILDIGKKENISVNYSPKTLNELEINLLRRRYKSEFRESALASLRKSFKYIIGKENYSDVMATYSSHFIQPFVMKDIL